MCNTWIIICPNYNDVILVVFVIAVSISDITTVIVKIEHTLRTVV